jgi:hypothetical protein
MLLLRYLLIASCFGLFACVAGMVLYDIYLAYELDRLLLRRENQPEQWGANRIRPIAPPEGEGMRLRASAREVNPPRVQTVTVPIDREFFLDSDGLEAAMASDSGNPLARPRTRP